MELAIILAIIELLSIQTHTPGLVIKQNHSLFQNRADAMGVHALEYAEKKLGGYLDGLSARLDPRVRLVLPRIPEAPRRLLAVRAYLKKPDKVKTGWSMTAEEIDRYNKSDERKEALSEIESVERVFSELNPGYSLWVNPKQVRTVDEQIASWNGVESIDRAGQYLWKMSLNEVSRPEYPGVPRDRDLDRFAAFLTGFTLSEPTTVAPPGLSLHGRARAFDFYVMKGRILIAGNAYARIDSDWEQPGWSAKLKEAIIKASKKLEGPLQAPYEPWHYTFHPSPLK